MKFSFIKLISVIFIVSSVILVATSCAGRLARVPLPFENEGTIDDVHYKIRVPEKWNGTLVLFCHGYRGWALSKDQREGQLAQRTKQDFGEQTDESDDAHEDALIEAGYALAGSAYRSNGFSVKEGIEDTVALTRHFIEKVGQPERILVHGLSMGSVITTKLIEEYPDIYDGGMAYSSYHASKLIDALLAFRLAYDVLFNEEGGFLPEWGTVGDLKDDIVFTEEVMSIFMTQFTNESNFGKFEFLRLTYDAEPEDYYAGVAAFIMYYATEGCAEIEARIGGPAGQNVGHVYTLYDDPDIVDEIAYLSDLGINAVEILKTMNGRTNIAIDDAAREFYNHVNYDGNLGKPLLVVHTVIDSITPVSQQSAYRHAVERAGKEDNLLQIFVDVVGHINLNPQQVVMAIDALDNWVKTGIRPDPEDESVFPAWSKIAPDFQPRPCRF